MSPFFSRRFPKTAPHSIEPDLENREERRFRNTSSFSFSQKKTAFATPVSDAVRTVRNEIRSRAADAVWDRISFRTLRGGPGGIMPPGRRRRLFYYFNESA